MRTPSIPRVVSEMLVAVVAVVVAVALFYLIAPYFVGGGHPLVQTRILNNLKQIELVKQLWAEDHNATGAVQITEQDLAPYFHNPSSQYSNFVPPVIRERYIINPLGVSPEAELTQDWKSLPKGTIFRMKPPGVQIVPPNAAPEPTRTAP